MRKDVDEQLWRLAERQDNVFSRDQAAARGADKAFRHRRVKARLWVPVGAAGYRPSGAPLTWRGQLRTAVWDAGPRALVSHDAAAQLFRFPGFSEGSVHVLVPRALDHECTIATVHSSRRFDLVRTTEMWGIQTVARADTIVHVAPTLRLKRLTWLTDELRGSSSDCFLTSRPLTDCRYSSDRSTFLAATTVLPGSTSCGPTFASSSRSTAVVGTPASSTSSATTGGTCIRFRLATGRLG